MKVGVISVQLNQQLTGIGNYTYNLIKELNKLDTNEDFLFLINHQNNTFFTNNEIIVNNPFPILKTYAWHPYLIRKLRRYKLDIFHNPSQVSTFLKSKQNYILTIHDMTPFLVPEEIRKP